MFQDRQYLNVRPIQERTHIWQYSKDNFPEDKKMWIFAGASVQVKTIIENLESMTNYWFRAVPVKRKGGIVWSDPVMKAIL